MNLDALFREAIPKMLIVQLHYRDFSKPAMVVEPHAYGLREGIPTVFVWDRAFSSEPNWENETGWRWLELEHILNAGLFGSSFPGMRRGYVHATVDMNPIYAQL